MTLCQDPQLTASLQAFVCSVVEQLLAHCSQLSYDGPTTAFHARHPPSISVEAYLARIFRYAPCSAECFITSLLYIKKVLDVKGLALLQQTTVHRLLITAVLLSSKYLDDIYYNNKFYAKIGGISSQEMNRLEVEMLLFLGYDLSVRREQFDEFVALLRSYAPNAPIELSALWSLPKTPAKDSVSCPSSSASFRPSAGVCA